MKKRGRPTKKATAKDKKKVKELLAEDAPVTEIAALLKLSVPTFRKLFAAELISGKKKKATAAKYKITKTHREKVVRHVACKTPIADICRLIGNMLGQAISEEDLEQHFAEELATGRVIYRDKVLESLETQMAAGNTSATNRLEAVTAIPQTPAKGGQSDVGASPAPAAHVIGKKAAARADAAAAAAAGGVFAPPPPPRLVVNNNPGD